jgi:hypothetical protein
MFYNGLIFKTAQKDLQRPQCKTAPDLQWPDLQRPFKTVQQPLLFNGPKCSTTFIFARA